ncbi:MAG: hypothetical protein WCC41_17985, partial [Rhodomicrobium sp.]
PLMVEVVLIGSIPCSLGFDGEDFRLREETSHRAGSAAVSQGTRIGNTDGIAFDGRKSAL